LVLIEGTLKRYLLPFFGKRPINSITTADFNEYDEWRLAQTAERRLHKWYWRNGDGNWLLELRYGNRPLKLNGDSTAVLVGKLEQLTSVIETLIEAVTAGELDKALAAAKKERMATLRKS
jgi:hypothetical protein